jgi:endoglucanase
MGSCFKSLTAKSIFAAMLILFSSASMASNLVADGTFDEATSTTWYGNAYNPVDGVNQADIGAAGNPWDVNLSGYVNVTAGADYTLSFDVSGADRTIVAGFGQSVAPYLGQTDTFTISAETQTIVMHLTAKADGVGEDFGGDTTRVIFDMGADTGAVSIDNVSLIAGHNGTETSNDLSFSLTVTAPGASMVLLATNIDGKTIGDPNDAYTATSNGDDTWTVVLDSVPASFSYQWVSDAGLSILLM